MAKLPSIEEMTKDVAQRVLQELTINDTPLEEFIVKVDGVAEFLKSEIRICDERLDGNPSEYYDGVGVGFYNSEILTLNHKIFCKKLLEMMNFEQ